MTVVLTALAVSALQTAPACSRRQGVAMGAGAALSLLLPRRQARAEDDAVMVGVLQSERTFAEGTVFDIQMRVVGRSSKGPLAQKQVPAAALPLDFAITRADFTREVPDFLWQGEDIYVRCDAVGKGPFGGEAVLASGKGKAKMVVEDGRQTHKTAYVTLE